MVSRNLFTTDTYQFTSYHSGYHVCSGSTAAGAGAVYGFMLWLLRTPQTIYFNEELKERRWKLHRLREGRRIRARHAATLRRYGVTDQAIEEHMR